VQLLLANQDADRLEELQDLLRFPAEPLHLVLTAETADVAGGDLTYA
jgi:hypothetical protein